MWVERLLITLGAFVSVCTPRCPTFPVVFMSSFHLELLVLQTTQNHHENLLLS